MQMAIDLKQFSFEIRSLYEENTNFWPNIFNPYNIEKKTI